MWNVDEMKNRLKEEEKKERKKNTIKGRRSNKILIEVKFSIVQ